MLRIAPFRNQYTVYAKTRDCFRRERAPRVPAKSSFRRERGTSRSGNAIFSPYGYSRDGVAAFPNLHTFGGGTRGDTSVFLS